MTEPARMPPNSPGRADPPAGGSSTMCCGRIHLRAGCPGMVRVSPSARPFKSETGIHVEVDELTGVYKNLTRGIVALVFRCKPSGGTERTSSESTAVSWLTPDKVSERMSEVFAVRLLDALDSNGPHVRSHDGKRLIPAG
ncbi:hypothetical protein [Streptomyces sp. PBH53]|uniref:hypothetical protein n=1 Tax=Streptomyces sp. PBH53 TaxID=1577075 RepID=UPI003965BA21